MVVERRLRKTDDGGAQNLLFFSEREIHQFISFRR
jgi:hypothetical protein